MQCKQSALPGEAQRDGLVMSVYVCLLKSTMGEPVHWLSLCMPTYKGQRLRQPMQQV